MVTSTGWALRQGTSEERPRSRAVTAFADQDVDDLTVLIERAVEVGPASGELDVGLVDEPAIARRMPAPGARSQ
ncbi:MAG: hypothetical protein JWP07_1803 [Pseudonocardiales bacterium]|nr:hypothetical protein [Pseudonocardiales bacterium]